MTILIVDDEELIRNVIKEYCLNSGYQVLEASDGYEAVQLVKNKNIDLIILDIMMPKKDGYTTLKELKDIKNIPVLMLSARDDEYDKLLGFELGIDDYVTKPFSPKELIARIKVILKRNNDEIFTYRDMILNFKSHVLTIEEKEIKLTPKEYELLSFLFKIKILLYQENNC